MSSKVAWLLIVAGTCLAAAPSACGETLTLLDEAYVRGPNVLLGDIAEIEGELAPVLESIDLGPAALPGDSKRLNAALVESRIRNSGVAVGELEVRGPSQVRAHTLYLEITSDMISNSLRAFIHSEMPWEPENAQVDVMPASQNFRVPDGEVAFEWEPNPEYRYLGVGIFRGAVLVDNEVQKRLSLKATIEAYADVVVAATDIPRGQILSPSQFELVKRPLSKLDSGTFSDPSALTGYIARTSIFTGQELTKRKIQPRQLIKRNQVVSVEMLAGGLRVQTQARALTPGAAGDLVLCANLSSKEEFQGVVREDGVVVVP